MWGLKYMRNNNPSFYRRSMNYSLREKNGYCKNDFFEITEIHEGNNVLLCVPTDPKNRDYQSIREIEMEKPENERIYDFLANEQNY